jgi:RNA polymerase primary sigma factor
MASSSGTGWWLDQIGRIPLLTPAEEIELGTAIQTWRNHPDPCPPGLRRRGERARERFIRANLRLSVAWVTKRCHRLAKHGAVDDLIQAANEGLMRAVERFDPTLGYRFSTYAYWWIRQSVNRWIDLHGRAVAIPGSHSQQIGKLSIITRELSDRLNRHPTREELAEEMGISMRVLADLLMNAKPIHSLDHHLDDNAQGYSLANTIAQHDLSLEEQEAAAEHQAMLAQLHAGIGSLPAIQQRIVTAFWGLDDGERRSRRAIAGEEGITIAQVAAHLAQAHAALRDGPGDVVIDVPLALVHLTPPRMPRLRVVRRRRWRVCPGQLELNLWACSSAAQA